MYYVRRGGKERGPVTADQLKSLAASGKLLSTDEVRKDGGQKWYPAVKVQGLFEAAAPTSLITHTPPAVVVSAPLDDLPCPFCGESILASAKKCKHCGEYLDPSLRSTFAPASAPVAAPAPQLHNTTVVQVGYNRTPRWSRGTAILLSLIIPGLGQMYKGQVINGLVWFLLTAAGYVALVIPGVLLHLCCVLGAAMGDPYR